MNSIHDNGQTDKSLEEGLDKLGQAYRKLKQDEPPELLDMAILNSAHRAVEKRPRRMSFGWLHGLTTTAVFVLAFSLIMNQREPAPLFEKELIRPQAAPIQRQMMEKKRAGVDQGKSRIEARDQDGERADALQSMPPSPIRREKASQTLNQVAEPQISNYVHDVPEGEKDVAQKPVETVASMVEEISLREADIIADAPALDAARQQEAVTADSAPPQADETQALEPSQTEAEQALQAIIELKQAGNRDWETALQSFIQRYPDYPLPESLRIP